MIKIFIPIIFSTSLLLSSCDTLKDLTTASNNKPTINSFDYSPKELNNKDEKINFTVVASDRDKKDILEYKWSTTKGTLSSNTGEIINWSPLKANGTCDFENSDGLSTISLLVSDGNGGTTTAQTNIRVLKGCKSGETVSSSTVVNTTKPTESVVTSVTPSPVPTSLVTPTPLPTIVATPLPSASPTTVPTVKSSYIPAKIDFVKLDIREFSGNNDGVANRGESIHITPHFRNFGGVKSNSLNIIVNSTSEFVDFKQSKSSVESLEPNETKESKPSFFSRYSSIYIIISKTIPSGTEIPLLFKLSDSFGNEYETTGSFTVQ